MLFLLEECEGCEALEERVLEDSWTGRQLCLSCWCNIIEDLTNSPASERDNLETLLEKL